MILSDDFELKSKIYSFNLRLVSKHTVSCILKMTFFGICFLLYFFKLSAGHGFYINDELNEVCWIISVAKGLRKNFPSR